jgi:spoIIIJ-associated protein
MEWVETTGKTVEEAKDAALDQLGVDEQDAEFEILEEPRAGLFGRTRGEARVRARIQPTMARPKVERRDRRGRDRQGRGGDKGRKGQEQRAAAKPAGSDAPAEQDAPAAEPGAVAVETAEDGTTEGQGTAGSHGGRAGGQRRSRRGGRGGGGSRRAHDDRDDDEGSTELSEAELQAQGEAVKGFLVDLLDAFGLDGEVAISTADDGALELAVTGPDLGLLIGPKGNTLQAIQELSRSALQRQSPGEAHAKVRIDVAGYRQRRREALERFTRDIAEQVRASGVQKALEPMSPPDRKVVHDTVNTIDGVTTISEGEDHRRRVVILPA